VATDIQARVRMYRHGLGGCFLVSLPRENGDKYFIMIDCGVIVGTADATARMQRVAADIVATTQGKLDLLIATHEHWDHLSGFIQAADTFRDLQVGQFWLAWTEDPADDLARQLADEKNRAVADLRLAAAQLHTMGAVDQAFALSGLARTQILSATNAAALLQPVSSRWLAARFRSARRQTRPSTTTSSESSPASCLSRSRVRQTTERLEPLMGVRQCFPRVEGILSAVCIGPSFCLRRSNVRGRRPPTVLSPVSAGWSRCRATRVYTRPAAMSRGSV
jgi:hypothetical protein